MEGLPLSWIRTRRTTFGESGIAKNSPPLDSTGFALKFWASAAYIPPSDQRTPSSSWMEFALRWNRTPAMRSHAIGEKEDANERCEAHATICKSQTHRVAETSDGGCHASS